MNSLMIEPVITQKPRFRGVNTKQGVATKKAESYFAVMIRNSQELENLENLIYHCDFTMLDYTNDGIFPKFLSVPDIDPSILRDGYLMRMYPNTKYPVKDITTTIFKEVVPTRSGAKFYAISPDNYTKLENFVLDLGLNPLEVLSHLKAVTL